MTTLFARFDEHRSTEVKLQNDDVTWMELAEEFLAFLQGCGYQMTREDFADYWAQYLPPEDLDDDIVISTKSCCGGLCESITASVTSPAASTSYTFTTMGDQK